ncbi:hypothetical protein ABE48_20555 [Bacillus thuringiensis]|nr:hypothetical protein [Bacillus thuringiensis]
MYQKSTKKKDKIGNTILSLAQGVNKGNNNHIFITLQFLLILNIKTINDDYIYIGVPPHAHQLKAFYYPQVPKKRYSFLTS